MPPVIALLRPKQWIKNLFVFAPLIFSRHMLEGGAVIPAVRLFGAFCFLASAVYVLNDIADRTADANHPKKRLRPIPSGTVGVPLALAMMGACMVASAALAIGLPVAAMGLLVLYAVINIAYSSGLKHVVIVDVFCVAAGFMVRVIAGAEAISVLVSPWLILCTMFLSLLLAVAKRRSELRLRDEGSPGATRAVLAQYTVSIVDQMTTITAAGVVISYALYTVSDRTVTMFKTENLVYSTIFVLFGVFRYLYLEHKERLGESPTDVVTTDMPLIAAMFLWVLSIVVVIYFRPV
jgi:4-hydroxybenzoate polyprenyltransferase